MPVEMTPAETSARSANRAMVPIIAPAMMAAAAMAKKTMITAKRKRLNSVSSDWGVVGSTWAQAMPNESNNRTVSRNFIS